MGHPSTVCELQALNARWRVAVQANSGSLATDGMASFGHGLLLVGQAPYAMALASERAVASEAQSATHSHQPPSSAYFEVRHS